MKLILRLRPIRVSCTGVITQVNVFHANSLILYPLKTKNLKNWLLFVASTWLVKFINFLAVSLNIHP